MNEDKEFLIENLNKLLEDLYYEREKNKEFLFSLDKVIENKTKRNKEINTQMIELNERIKQMETK